MHFCLLTCQLSILHSTAAPCYTFSSAASLTCLHDPARWEPSLRSFYRGPPHPMASQRGSIRCHTSSHLEVRNTWALG